LQYIFSVDLVSVAQAAGYFIFTQKNLMPLRSLASGYLFLLLLVTGMPAKAGAFPADSVFKNENHNARKLLIGSLHTGLWSGSLLMLNKEWYANYPKTSFHLYDDHLEWQQMDKCGHVWSAYQISRLSDALWRWSGVPGHEAVYLGGVTGIAYQSIVEILDGYSAQWGFSLGDMAANVLGAGGYVAQELAWNEQKIRVKFSYRPVRYPSELNTRITYLFGNTYAQRMLKDYNAQTYWLSINPALLGIKTQRFRWMNIALGYSASGMLGPFRNHWMEPGGGEASRYDLRRERRFLISPDIDLERIRVRRRLPKIILFGLNAVRLPSPALSVDSRGRIMLHLLYF
jgi:hypothetical protein